MMDVQQEGLCVAGCEGGSINVFDLHAFGNDALLQNMTISGRHPSNKAGDDAPALVLDGCTIVAASHDGMVVAGARDGQVHMRMCHEKSQETVSSIVKRGYSLVRHCCSGFRTKDKSEAVGECPLGP